MVKAKKRRAAAAVDCTTKSMVKKWAVKSWHRNHVDRKNRTWRCVSINIDDEKVTEHWATNDDPTEDGSQVIESAKAEAKAAAAKATGQLKASKA